MDERIDYLIDLMNDNPAFKYYSVSKDYDDTNYIIIQGGVYDIRVCVSFDDEQVYLGATHLIPNYSVDGVVDCESYMNLYTIADELQEIADGLDAYQYITFDVI